MEIRNIRLQLKGSEQLFISSGSLEKIFLIRIGLSWLFRVIWVLIIIGVFIRISVRLIGIMNNTSFWLKKVSSNKPCRTNITLGADREDSFESRDEWRWRLAPKPGPSSSSSELSIPWTEPRRLNLTIVKHKKILYSFHINPRTTGQLPFGNIAHNC